MISVITVTYNAQATLPLTIRSLQRQSYRDFEWIVVDGKSKDDTLAIARDSGIANMRMISEPDGGIYDAMNKGLRMAKGDYVVFLNAGDAFHGTTALELVAQAIENNDRPGIVYGQTDIVDIDCNRVGERHLMAPPALTLASFKEGMVVCHQAFFVMRRLAQPYNLQYRYSADYEWCIRCLQRSRHNVYVDAVLVDYLNEGVTTRNRYRSLRERFAIMSYYYGFMPTLLRHFKFIPRFIRERLRR